MILGVGEWLPVRLVEPQWECMHTLMGPDLESTLREEDCQGGQKMWAPETRLERQTHGGEEPGGMRREALARRRIEELVHMLV